MDVILVPGLWLDASSWDGVVPILERAGHTPRALTMPGVGEPVSIAAHVGFDDWVATVVAEIDRCDAPAAVIGHAAGANAAWAAADARAEHVAHVLFVDSVPPASGFGISEFPSRDGVVPFPGWEYFDGADIADLDDVTRDAVNLSSVPMRVPTDAVELSNPARRDIPVTLLSGRQDETALRNELAHWGPWEDELMGIRDMRVIHLGTGHWPQLSEPSALADAIVRALGQGGTRESVSVVQGRVCAHE